METVFRKEKDIYGLNNEQLGEALTLYVDKLIGDIYNEVSAEHGIDINDPDLKSILDFFMNKAITKGMELVDNHYDVIQYYNQYRKNKNKNLITKIQYGWLAPDGTFYPVNVGHLEYAAKIINDNNLEEAFELWNSDNFKHTINGLETDFLIYAKNWVLLHNPKQGMAFPLYNEKGMTKAQKDFLFGYYIDRGEEKLANDIFKDD